jgi:hypothetical protein
MCEYQARVVHFVVDNEKFSVHDVAILYGGLQKHVPPSPWQAVAHVHPSGQQCT